MFLDDLLNGSRKQLAAELFVLPGENHLAGLGRGEEILAALMKIWDERG